MEYTRVDITDVAYNAATQSFEAMVTVASNAQATRYPCTIEAPITMSFEQAAQGLRKQALRQHRSGKGLYSQIRRHVAGSRAGRTRFDPQVWLARLGFGSLDRAA